MSGEEGKREGEKEEFLFERVSAQKGSSDSKSMRSESNRLLAVAIDVPVRFGIIQLGHHKIIIIGIDSVLAR